MTTRTSGAGWYSAQPSDKVKPFSFSGPPQGDNVAVCHAVACGKAPSGCGKGANCVGNEPEQPEG